MNHFTAIRPICLLMILLMGNVILIAQKIDDEELAHDLITDKFYALIFSPNTNPDYADLDNAIAEGERLRDILQNRYEFEEVKLIKNPNRNDFLDELSKVKAKMKQGDNLFVYFNGHGDTTRNEHGQIEGYWVMSDTRKADPDTWVTNESVRQILEEIRCRHILLVVDACFGGSLAHRGRSSVVLQDYIGAESCYAISSAGLNTVPDGNAFFQGLESILRTNQRLLLRERELYRQIETFIEQERQKDDSPVILTTPKHFSLDNRMNGQFVFKLKKQQPLIIPKQTTDDQTKNTPVPTPIPQPGFNFQNHVIEFRLPAKYSITEQSNVIGKLYDKTYGTRKQMYPRDLQLVAVRKEGNDTIVSIDISSIDWYQAKQDKTSLSIRLRFRAFGEKDVELGIFNLIDH